MKTITIQNLAQEGMTSDIREETKGIVKLIQHFDFLSRPKTITPYPVQVNGDTSSTTNQIVDFIYYNNIAYGRGVVSGTAKAEIYKKSDFTLNTWGTYSNNAAPSGSATPGVFVEYHGRAYGGNNGAGIWKNDLSGVSAWVNDDTSGAFAGTLTANGIVHSKDDILYMAASNVVLANNNGSWNVASLTLPSRYTITCLAEYGNYLAIACKPLYPGGRSVVYLWDRDSTLNTISEVIDFGTGNLQIIEQVEGEIIGISLRTEVLALPSPYRLTFRRYSGGTADVFNELQASLSGVGSLGRGFKQNQRLYFSASLTIDGTIHNGIWGIAKNKVGRWVVWFERMPIGDTVLNASPSIQGFMMVADGAFISYTDNSANPALSQTGLGTIAYTGTSILETVNNPDMPEVDRPLLKQLHTVAVLYDILPADGQVILKYKVDGGSWITVLTETTDSAVATEMTRDAAGTSFTSGREYQFRIESTGGAIITGLAYKYENLQTTL